MNESPPPTQVDLYWRPGCGFCSMLRRKLDKVGIERVEHNIWDDPAGAAVVRGHARGNETVPTIVVGDVGLVNPSADDLIALLRAEAPHLLPAETGEESPGPVGRILNRMRGS